MLPSQLPIIVYKKGSLALIPPQTSAKSSYDAFAFDPTKPAPSSLTEHLETAFASLARPCCISASNPSARPLILPELWLSLGPLNPRAGRTVFAQLYVLCMSPPREKLLASNGQPLACSPLASNCRKIGAWAQGTHHIAPPMDQGKCRILPICGGSARSSANHVCL